MLGVVVGGGDLLTLSVAAAVSNIRGSGSKLCGGSEDSVAYYLRIFDVKSQRIVYVTCKTKVIKSFAKGLLDGSEA